ncbi:hypothetical protein TeGR_g5475 [Tetraparma gracilis]|uniref:SAM-dependent MTase RsmB/NOP-type domain-containing protein n=1 Tax=Tetraparma gracilis TaxID=2962635 RepID=A0ABQ6M713_9STRA|nr:hypothetical protein TeGR_g5475 [Tetraparma gracilis]
MSSLARSPSPSPPSASPPSASPLSASAASYYSSSTSLAPAAIAAYLSGAASPAHRFVRLAPPRSGAPPLSSEELSSPPAELLPLAPGDTPGDTPVPVPWLPVPWLPVPWLPPRLLFYALPHSKPLSSLPAYAQGLLYGMDASSGAAVAALSLPPPSSSGASSAPQALLDLCCCPGMKLQLARDLLPPGSRVVGVDLSRPRLEVARALLRKYEPAPPTVTVRLYEGDGATFPGGAPAPASARAAPRVTVQLYESDGATFPGGKPALAYDSRAALSEAPRGRSRMNKSARARERSRLAALAAEDPPPKLYDYVLVDAECSTDGSVTHLKRRPEKHQPEPKPLAVSPAEQAELAALQLRLLRNGYARLKRGGALVYSTCSLSREQNEGVVGRFLKGEGGARTERIEELGGAPCEEGGVEHSLRFLPDLGEGGGGMRPGSGFWIVRIRKGE